MIHEFFILTGTVLCLAAAGYALFAVYAVLVGVRRAAVMALRERHDPSRIRPVSVLKPLCGAEPALYANLRSFFIQAHPCFQLVFGVHDAQDPALEVVRRLQAEFPQVDTAVVIDPRVHGANLKVSNLINLLPQARHEWLVLADSDIGVAPDYLEHVTAPLAESDVGVVTCLYRGVPRGNLWSRIGALFIDDWFAPSVQVSHAFGSTRFAFGSTIALRRETLLAAGGLEALRDVLADDYWLGEFTRRRGLRTVLSHVVVSTDVTENSLAELWRHELRWLRTARGAAPTGFAFVFVTFTFPVLLAGLALARTELALALSGLGVAARLVLHYLQRQWRLEPSPKYELLLLPLCDSLMLAIWAAAMTGSRVQWREQALDAGLDRVATGPAPAQQQPQPPSPASPEHPLPNRT
ncbi:MAG: bacteriohopanetetrol glucosamine biosynthesis glycosyltransferase HpnI, partial [Nevskia sp.]|nr:bacteriohopanetetrol glucosamine biosynthesis glycosyltransferase HpnI [Nevskia sp.]